MGRSMAACEGAGHAEETLQHQRDRQPGNMGFQGLFSAACIINFEVYNLSGKAAVCCPSPADFMGTLSSSLNF